MAKTPEKMRRKNVSAGERKVTATNSRPAASAVEPALAIAPATRGSELVVVPSASSRLAAVSSRVVLPRASYSVAVM